MYNFAEKRINQDLDISVLLKRLYDIDKFKLMMFKNDKHQLMLYNTLAKPVLSQNAIKIFFNDIEE